MPTLSIKKEWRDQMKKKMIIYSWENSLRCLFEVKSDNVIPWSRNNQHPGGMRMILSNLRRAFPRLTPGAGLYQPSLVVVAVTAGALSNADVNRQSQILHIMRSYYLEKQGLIAKISVSSPPHPPFLRLLTIFVSLSPHLLAIYITTIIPCQSLDPIC